MSRIFLICCVISAVASVKISQEKLQDLEVRLSEIKNQLFDDANETRSEVMKEIYSELLKTKTKAKEGQNSFACGMCYTVMNYVLLLRRIQKKNDEYLKTLAMKMCIDLEIQSEEVCHGVIEYNAPSLFYIVDNRTDLTSDTLCKLYFDDGICVFPHFDRKLDFTVKISERKVSNQSRQAFDIGHNLTIIHFTDIHYDPKYQQGAFADCEEYACCREIDEVNEIDPSSNAGHWGDYRSCDTPLNAIRDAFQQIKREHSKIDAIYFTGDIVNHFMWDVSVESMKDEIEEVYDLMREVFGDTPIYSVLGNHEPQNIFVPVEIDEPSLSTQWLYDQVADLWMDKLPPEALQTIKNGGYYTTVLRPGLRLIALNNNICLMYNWWIIYSVKAIATQFQWLHDVLLSAEKVGEKVHILLHVPNGDKDLHQPCSREYRRIVERFHDTIVAQFYGHTEFFEFNLFFENKFRGKPINVAWSGGSLATFSGVNRNYNIYNIDPNSFRVTDVETWIYNLTAANQHDSENPSWFRQFSFREAFNLPDLLPLTMNDFVETLVKNSSEIQQLWKMRIRNSDLLLKKGCDKNCLAMTLCEILITDNNDLKRCERVKREVKGP